ncbi:MAG TPA: HEAT repeat domain-containing protein [Gemmata sp.]
MPEPVAQEPVPFSEPPPEPRPVVHVTGPEPRGPEPFVSEPETEPNWGPGADRPFRPAIGTGEGGTVAAIASPPPAPRKAVAGRFAAPLARASDTPAPRYAEPVQLQTQADIAAALTAAITSRMKPPAAPRRDLRPSTAVWMLLTGLGVAFVLVSLFGGLDYRWTGLAVGVVQIVIGYAWIVRLTHLRDPKRGLLCAVPFITPFYLSQPKYAKLRPLRFVLTGAALAGLAVAAPALASLTRPLVQPSAPKAPPPDITTQSKLVQVRAYRERREHDNLTKVLEVLVKTDPIRSADARDRAELAAELEGLCKHEDRLVRLEAMAAFVRWEPDPNAAKARQVCLEAIRSSSGDERLRALVLLPRWKDADCARAVQSLIGRPGRQTNQAKAALEEIGGAPAEQAALALLNRAEDQATRLIAVDILAKVGGPSAADELTRYAQASDDLPVRSSALLAVNVIRARTRPAAP